MKTKIESQKEFEVRIDYFKDKYIEDFKDLVSPPGCNKNDVREKFKRYILEMELHSLFNIDFFKEANNFRNDKKSLNGINTFEAIEIFCKSKDLKSKFQSLLQSLAEHDGILNVYAELNLIGPENQNQPTNKKVQNEKDNLNSKIENNFNALKKTFNNEEDYLRAVNYLKVFFLSEQISITEPLFVKSGNIKSMAFALGEIWRTQKNETITFEYLNLYKKLFSIFKKQKIDKKNIFGCNLYKYSISKT